MEEEKFTTENISHKMEHQNESKTPEISEGNNASPAGDEDKTVIPI